MFCEVKGIKQPIALLTYKKNKVNEENENIEQICSYLLSQEILWLITPPGEYDHKSNTFWLEESQGISQTEETWNAQLMLQLKESGIKIVIGLNRRIYKEYGVYHILYSLKFQINEQLEVLKEQTKFNPTNLMRLDFQISEIEIWNQKSNFIRSHLKNA